ncbi:MAG: hypothetical protein JNL87_16075 [Burkholderiaceae bacterium]|nr:hypothetical protein [Burkholderiaceae bacterium]
MTTALMPKRSAVAACAAIACAAASPAFAQSTSPAQALLDQSWVFNLGGFFVQSDLKASLNGTSAKNPDIDFDETFGKADKSNRARADLLWRINPKHHVALMYFDNRNTRSKALDRQISWGDNVYDVGAVVTSETKFKIGALSYEYAFMREPSYEVAGSIGLHVTDMTLGLSGDAKVNGVPTSKATQSNSVTAPLPVLGLRGAWVVTPNVLLEAQGQVFKIKVNDIDGNWSDLQAKATWMFNKNFGLGLGYDRYYNRIDVEKPEYNGRVKMGYSGLQLFGVASF